MSQPNSVLDPIESSWKELSTLVQSMGADALTVTGPDGWAVKDHLAHVAAWEASLIALLEGGDRGAAMGIAATGEQGTDEINHELWAHHHAMTPEAASAGGVVRRVRWWNDPGAIEDLRSRAVEPNDVVPAVCDR